MALEKPLILIVDDETLNIDVLVDLLKEEYRSLAAKEGERALKLARSETRPDLILLDIMMPGMDGFDVCRRLKADPATREIPVIFVTANRTVESEATGLELGAVDFIAKPVSPPLLLARVRMHLAFADQSRYLETQVRERTAELQRTQTALREAMENLLTIQVTPGVTWLQIPEAGLFILCGCPGEVVKHLMRRGLIRSASRDGVEFETGPNVVLLSDLLVQNGGFANLAEFPVLQMLYRQGMMLPGHPNNTGAKPMLMGVREQVRAQMEYIYRGNYGLVSKEEIMACGVDGETADLMMRIKLKFAFGAIRPPEEFVDALELDETPVEIKNGATVQRIGFNRYRFSYRGRSADVDMNLPPDVTYESPYTLGSHHIRQHYFAILHTGEGDGWDVRRPSMGSVVMFQGRIYLIDAGPAALHSLTALGIDINEVEGVFQTHAHDDHFAGLPALIHSDRRLKYYATPLVCASAAKKFAALMSLDEEKFGQFFDLVDLQENVWNDCDGLEVRPLFSPHPVETTVLLFRAMDGEGYKTYAHLADLSSFKVLDEMTGTGEEEAPAAFMETVRNNYLLPADLKKLDVGGGLIHGAAEDFREDRSGRLILAHIDRKLNPQEMEIGSESSFGALDVLIPGNQDYLRQRAFRFLQTLFPDVSQDQIQMLINSEIEEFNAGTIIRRPGEPSDHVDMILSGTVAYLEAEAEVRNHLSFGSLIGARGFLRDMKVSEGAYRAVSHCSVIRFRLPLLEVFLESNHLLDHLRSVVGRVWFLRKTWLFGEQASFFRLADIAEKMTLVAMGADTDIDRGEGAVLWLLAKGRVLMLDADGAVRETIRAGGFFGEETFLSTQKAPWRFRTDGAVELYRLKLEALLEIPIVHWKMLEMRERRVRLFSERRHGKRETPD